MPTNSNRFSEQYSIANYVKTRVLYRYLAKTFQLAFDHVQPDVVIFLGDLIDEGSVATDVEYELYVNRFRQIFGTSTANVKVVFEIVVTANASI